MLQILLKNFTKNRARSPGKHRMSVKGSKSLYALLKSMQSFWLWAWKIRWVWVLKLVLKNLPKFVKSSRCSFAHTVCFPFHDVNGIFITTFFKYRVVKAYQQHFFVIFDTILESLSILLIYKYERITKAVNFVLWKHPYLVYPSQNGV